jgi:hypothetical protein
VYPYTARVAGQQHTSNNKFELPTMKHSNSNFSLVIWELKYHFSVVAFLLELLTEKHKSNDKNDVTFFLVTL